MSDIIISLDQGSSNSRAALIEAKTGKILAKKFVPLPFEASQNTFCYDGASLYNTQIEALLEVLNQVGSSEITAIALSAQRSTIVLWDKDNGSALCPVLSWLDGRAAKISAQNLLSQQVFHQKTGLYNTPYFSAPKIKWCLENYPHVKKAYERGRLCVGPVSSFLLWRMSEGKIFACDGTFAQRTLLYNINTKTWDEELLQSFGLEKTILPEVKHSFDDYGSYDGIPIKLCLGDQQAASAACGLLKEGSANINYGTGAFFLLNIGQKQDFIDGILTSLSWDSLEKNADYILEAPLITAGSLFTWLQKLGFDFTLQTLQDIAKKAREEVLFLPALGGLGAPWWNYNLKPVISGLEVASTKEDIIFAAVRGLNFIMTDIIYYLKQKGYNIASLQMSGGLSKDGVLPQLQSDILQIPLAQQEEKETTLIGAAAVCAKNMGYDVDAWQQNLKLYTPKISAQDAILKYQRWRQFFDWAIKQNF
ncbi:MAG: hypothetical protein IKP23_06230 [Elusimicrobiaceae bacterium]|nr:hypothetical protein [Elusimicrobiaceae bacterium]